MEQLLIKLARQLDALDEASLSALWEKYAALVQNFEPTERWQEAVLVFSFIQAKQWKNHLFNTLWAERVRPLSNGTNNGTEQIPPGLEEELRHYVEDALRSTRETAQTQPRAKVLPFIMPKNVENEPLVPESPDEENSDK